MPLSCRFYAQKFPEAEDVVKVNVKSIAEMGAYVTLKEYNNIEGMILLSELSRRRIRSINKLIKIGRDECVVVIRVDKDKGYIDLSKRRVSPEDILKCDEKYANARAVNSILRHVGEIMEYDSDEQLEKLYEKTAWYFDKKFKKPTGSFDAFKQAVIEPNIFDECDLDEKTKKVLLDNIRMRLTPQAVKIRADIEVSCYSYEGIDAVKKSLKTGMSLSTEEMPVKINLIAPPLYVVTTTTLERDDGLKAINDVLAKISESILENKGVFVIRTAPKVVTDNDEAELAKQLEQLKLENQEMDEDDEEDDDESGSSGEEEDTKNGNV